MRQIIHRPENLQLDFPEKNRKSKLKPFGSRSLWIGWTLCLSLCTGAHAQELKPLGQYWHRTARTHGLFFDAVKAKFQAAGWDFLGHEFQVYSTAEPDSNLIPLYYATAGNQWMYTRNLAEYQNIARAGWQPMGVAGYVYDDNRSAPFGAVPLYRLYHPRGDHYFTVSENDMMTATLSDGYHLERIAAYVMPIAPVTHTITISKLNLNQKPGHFRLKGTATATADGVPLSQLQVRVWYYLRGGWFLPMAINEKKEVVPQNIRIDSNGKWDSGFLSPMENDIQAVAALLSDPSKGGLKEFSSAQTRPPYASKAAWPAAEIQRTTGAWSWSDLSKKEVENLVRKTAPWIQFHPYEKYLPSSVEFFMEGCSLKKDGVVVMPQIGSSRDLAAFRNGAAITGNADATWEMDILDSERQRIVAGNLSQAKAYVHLKPASNGDLTAQEIQWWFFFPHNGNGHYYGNAFKATGAHDGDWESVAVRVRRNGTVVAVFGSAHGAEQGWYYPKDTVQLLNETHPIMHAAVDSHAMYGLVGDKVDDYIRKIPRVSVGGWIVLWDLIADGRKPDWDGRWLSWKLWDKDSNCVILDHQNLDDSKWAWFHFIGDWGDSGPDGPKWKEDYNNPLVDGEAFGGVQFYDAGKLRRREIPGEVSAISEIKRLFPDVTPTDQFPDLDGEQE
ncbi:MAG: DUF946 domain-containing protein [Planctomycetota bacterium]|nr:MAG: DUF946 domain-containing protein [Planctomycetota bacterium]